MEKGPLCHSIFCKIAHFQRSSEIDSWQLGLYRFQQYLVCFSHVVLADYVSLLYNLMLIILHWTATFLVFGLTTLNPPQQIHSVTRVTLINEMNYPRHCLLSGFNYPRHQSTFLAWIGH